MLRHLNMGNLPGVTLQPTNAGFGGGGGGGGGGASKPPFGDRPPRRDR